MPRKKAAKLEPVGKKLKKIRCEKKITFDMLANETGLAIDNLKKIEAGDILPPVGTLMQLSRALRIDSGVFLNEAETVRKDAFTRRTQNYAYTTLTPGAEAKRMKAFRVSIDPMQEHEGISYKHEGEEFVYVLAGKIELTVGEHVNVLNSGESLLFNSGVQHLIQNISEGQAELLVVICSP